MGPLPATLDRTRAASRLQGPVEQLHAEHGAAGLQELARVERDHVEAGARERARRALCRRVEEHGPAVGADRVAGERLLREPQASRRWITPARASGRTRSVLARARRRFERADSDACVPPADGLRARHSRTRTPRSSTIHRRRSIGSLRSSSTRRPKTSMSRVRFGASSRSTISPAYTLGGNRRTSANPRSSVTIARRSSRAAAART